MEYIGTADEAYVVFDAGPARGLETVFDMYPGLSNVTGLQYYPLRTHVLSRPVDYNRLSPLVRAIYHDLIAHFAATGTPVAGADHIVWSDEVGAVFAQHPGLDLCPFQFTPKMRVIRDDPRWLEVVSLYEHKGRLADLWQGQGFTPPSVAVYGQSRKEAALDASAVWEYLGKRPGRLKLAYGASGDQQPKFRALSQLKKLLKDLAWQDVDFVIQRDVGQVEISVNYYIDGAGKLYCLFTTLQQIEDSKHVGNIEDYTYEHAARAITDVMARDALDRGMKGFFGFDLMVDRRTGRVWVIECNARVTAPVYGWILARKHGVARFGVATVKGVQGNTIVDALHPSLWYSKTQGKGIIVFNPGPIPLGEYQGAALAPTQEGVIKLLADAKQTATAPIARVSFA
ncbi:ATP-grasp domain-containing protein [Candidatus Nomurabacteria bacterium]|nr:ATP-grasp domain-containing protein [Candidatus Nomurabacteria bacterium]